MFLERKLLSYCLLDVGVLFFPHLYRQELGDLANEQVIRQISRPEG